MRYEFDERLCIENDQIGKKHAMKLIWDTYWEKPIENPDKYGIDLIITDKSGRIVKGYEVERSKCWQRGSFPYPFLHIQDRKRRYAFFPYPTHFIMLNFTCQHAVIFDLHKLPNYRIEIVKNALEDRLEETFFIIPRDHITLLECL